MNGADVVVEILEKAGVDTIFGLEGGHIDPILHKARDKGFTLLDTRHEAVSGYAADGFARVTKGFAVCVVTAGPGFTNTLSSITSCYLDCVPVLYIIGASPLRDLEKNVLQGDFNQVAMARPVTKWAGRATSPGTVATMARAAIRAMFEGQPGPALLEIPVDVVHEEIDAADLHLPDTILELHRVVPHPDQIDLAARLLSEAERPLIIAGFGAVMSDCGEELVALAERLGAPVFTNFRGIGAIPGTNALACGTVVNIAKAELDPDVILMVGARHGLLTGGESNNIIRASAKLVQIDVSPLEIGRLHPVHVGLQADAKETLLALLADLPEQPLNGTWVKKCRDSNAWLTKKYAPAFATGNQKIHPYFLTHTVASFVDDTTIVVQDGGDTSGWTEVAMARRIAGAGQHLASGYLGNLGMHQGLAIGAQVARPDHRVIAITGDGAIGFNIQEFDTMVRHNLPIITIVNNNLAWGMSLEYQSRQPHGLTWVHLGDNMRYDKICEDCGGHGELVVQPEDLVPAIERAIASGKPACVNVITQSMASYRTEAFLQADGIDDIVMPYYENIRRG